MTDLTDSEIDTICADAVWERTPFKQSGLARWQAQQREAAEARKDFLDSLPAPTADERRQKAMAARAALVRFHAARRRVVKLQRTPPWADQKQILSVYRKAKQLSDATGEQHHVDHIIPLQGKLVSGLHVESNLQVIPWLKNIVKRNKFEAEE